MTISSTSSTPPPVSPSFATDPKPPAPQTADTPTWQPPAKSPLPPGQGTRIDQLV